MAGTGNNSKLVTTLLSSALAIILVFFGFFTDTLYDKIDALDGKIEKLDQSMTTLTAAFNASQLNDVAQEKDIEGNGKDIKELTQDFRIHINKGGH